MKHAKPRVVIGAGRPNKLAALVCEFTIKTQCDEVEVIHTYDHPFIPGDEQGIDNILHRSRWENPFEWISTPGIATMFSYCRHMVPEICLNEGHAIYLDADMLVFDTVQEIWDLDMGGAGQLGVEGCHQISVLKIDCEDQAEWTIERLLREGRSYRSLMKNQYLREGQFVRRIPAEWNHLDRKQANTKLLHYTNMRTQPWVVPGHRFGGVWFDQLAEAISTRAISIGTVKQEIREARVPWAAACYPQPHVLDELRKRIAIG